MPRLICILLFVGIRFASAQIPVQVDGLQAYEAAISIDPGAKLVELKKVIPSIQLDIRYATKNNFMGRRMYRQARAFARRPVAESLKKVQEELRASGLGIKIFDGYRPYSVTVDFYKFSPDKSFVANPAKGSRHNRGCAVDLSLIDLKTGRDLEMPTGYDSFEAAAAANYEPVTAKARNNRALLIRVMEKHGFKVLSNEWWHFDFIGWEKYPLLDIPFEQL